MIRGLSKDLLQKRVLFKKYIIIIIHHEKLLESFIMLNEQEILDMLIGRGLIMSSMNYRHCVESMALMTSKKKIDSFEWRCKNAKCSKYKTTISIRSGSKFEGLKLPFRKILKVILYWSEGMIQNEIMQVVQISRTALASI